MAGQLWAVNTLGGYAYSDNLSKTLRLEMQPGCRFDQLCDAKNAVGLHKGQTFNWDIYSDVSDDGTLGQAHLSETEVMPEDNFTISQGSLTIGEYGRAVPYTGLLDNLSEQPIKEVIRRTLRNHAVKSLDRAAAAKFATTPLRVSVTNGTTVTSANLATDGAADNANAIALANTHVKGIADLMAERNIPAYGHGDYYAIGRPTTFRAFKDDLEALSYYVETGFAKIANGEVGRYEGIRFLQQTNVPVGVGSTAGAAWANSLSDTAYFMGEDTVAKGIAILPEIRGKLPGDYGRSKGVAWYALGGYGLVHSAQDQARIMMWDSSTAA